MNNAEQISQILTIILMALGALLIVLVCVYVTILFKNKNKENSNKQKKELTQKNSKNASKKNVVNYNKKSVFDFMEFDKIEDNMIIQKDGLRYILIMQCQGVNYDLLSEAEKNGVEEGFLQFLNTLRYPIQIYIQTRTVNLENSLINYKNNVNEIERELNKKKIKYQNNVNSGAYTSEELEKQYYEIVKQTNLLEYGKDIINNTEPMSKNKNVLNNKYYIAIYYYPDEVNENMDKYEIQEAAFSDLYTKAQSIIRTLYSCSVTTKILNSNEIAELLYVAYNRDESETFDFETAMKSGYQELYSTAPDIWDKKIRVLNKRINDQALKIANEAIDNAKSERQKQYELKSENMEQLAKEMATLIIEENNDYIGRDIAQDAIDTINKKMDEWKEENEDEEKPKAKRGRKPRKSSSAS